MHSKRCSVMYPECACLSCKRDNYGKELVPCCWHSKKACEDPKCYERREEDEEDALDGLRPGR